MSSRNGQSLSSLTQGMAQAQIRKAEHEAMFPNRRETNAYRNGYSAALQDVADAAQTEAPASERVRFRIYTEGKAGALAIVQERVRRYVNGATLSFGVGIYNGTLEDSLTVDIIGLRSDLQQMTFLAGDIKHALAQESVLLTVDPVEAFTV